MLLIRNGYVMDPKSKTEGIRDILIEDKKIVKIGENLLADMSAEESAHLEIIDAELERRGSWQGKYYKAVDEK